MSQSNRQKVLDLFLNKDQEIIIYHATVVGVKGSTCTVTLNSSDLEIEGVLLMADESANEGVLLKPKKGSTVLVGCIENEVANSFVCQYSEIESGSITIGNSAIEFDKNTVNIKKGTSTIGLDVDAVDIKKGQTAMKIDANGVNIKMPNSAVKVLNSGISLQYGLLQPDGKVSIDLSANGAIKVDDKTLFQFDKDVFGMGKENSSISFGDDQVLIEQGGASMELTNEKVSIKNQGTSLKEVFDDLADLLQNFKVVTSTGPSTTLFVDTAIDLASFRAKYPSLLM
jgi:hypothetical protein